MPIESGLIGKCLNNDIKAQKELYDRVLPYLRALSNRYLKDDSYSKDVLQESFIKIFQNLQNFNPERASIKTWSAKILINTCYNYNKRVIKLNQTNITEDLDLLIKNHHVSDVNELWSQENMLRILKQMPAKYFEVFNLYIIDGYSYKEISEITGLNEAACRKRISRGRNWLKEIFENKPSLISQLKLSYF